LRYCSIQWMDKELNSLLSYLLGILDGMISFRYRIQVKSDSMFNVNASHSIKLQGVIVQISLQNSNDEKNFVFLLEITISLL
jgi:hypothetical protein